MLNDKALLVNRFISVPKDLGDVNCGAFLGIELGVEQWEMVDFIGER